MVTLVLGLVLFLGAHSVRVFADGWRTAMVARVGEKAWKGGYAVVAIVGFGLILWGFSLARHDPVVLWPQPPTAVRHVAALLVLIAFVLLVAAYVPGNQVKAWVHHPMVLGVKLWAFAHLIANNTLADLVLFGAFLLWAVLDFRASRRRDRAEGTVYPAGRPSRTAVTVVVGVVAWAVFAFWLHASWIGVAPFGRSL
ncbi:MAG: protein NrnU [Ramlibacter sp.]|nr:protein NrnU [Ramlibacter sp.]